MARDTESVPSTAVLDSINAPSGQTVTFQTDELTALCPMDFGGPDYYQLTIRYETDGESVESKSLKQYLEAFRNEEATAEQLARAIHDDVDACADPKKLYVRLEQARRGGIEETVEEGDHELAE